MKVITFSRYFPATHPRKGEPTFFVEKILKSFPAEVQAKAAYEYGYRCSKFADNHINALDTFSVMSDLFLENVQSVKPKFHTIRAGNRWKSGETFSARVWSGRPYVTKQIEFAQIEIKKIFSFEVDINGVAAINGTYLFGEEDENEIAKNDGLNWEDFNEWLLMPCFRKHKTFTGQIICWNENINY